MKMENISTLIEKIRHFTLGSVTPSRYEHSVRVSKMCVTLCKKFDYDTDSGMLAGIAHDMCKNMNDRLLISIALRDGNPISEIERLKPPLLHGRAAAVKLREDYKVQNVDVLEAVANHTFGRKGLCTLGKILYVADKIEPGRENVNDKYLEKMFALDLDSMVVSVIEDSLKYLKKKDKTISPITIEFYESLKK